jgi:hypothetical protein
VLPTLLVSALAVVVAPAGPAAAVVNCHGATATMVGSGIIDGTSGDDVIVGSSGDDTIDGRGGDDIICGGDGGDTIWGGVSMDENSGNQSDLCIGNTGNDDIKSALNGYPDECEDIVDRQFVRGGAGDPTATGAVTNPSWPRHGSSSTIVTPPTPNPPTVALTGSVNAMSAPSSASSSVSPFTVSAMVFDVSPGWNVSVPVGASKSPGKTA